MSLCLNPRFLSYELCDPKKFNSLSSSFLTITTETIIHTLWDDEDEMKYNVLSTVHGVQNICNIFSTSFS